MTATALLYVYGFCAMPIRGDFELPAGIASQTCLIQTETLGAIAEAHLDISALKDNDQQLVTAILSHDRVLQTVFDQVPVLPLRFGTQFAHEASLSAYLRQHQSQHLQQLRQLAHKAEYLLRLTPQDLDVPAPKDDLTGRAYFLAKKHRLQAQAAHQQAQQQQLQALLTHLQQADNEVVLSPAQGQQQRLHLLADRQSAWVPEALSQWQSIAPTWAIDCSPPLPPYHFAHQDKQQTV